MTKKRGFHDCEVSMDKDVLLQPIAKDPTNRISTYQLVKGDNKFIIYPCYPEEKPEQSFDETVDEEIVDLGAENYEEDVEESVHIVVIQDPQDPLAETLPVQQIPEDTKLGTQSPEAPLLLPQEPLPYEDVKTSPSSMPSRDFIQKIIGRVGNRQKKTKRSIKTEGSTSTKQRQLSIGAEDNQWYFSESIRTDFVVTFLSSKYNSRETIRQIKERHPEIANRSISRNTPRVLLNKFLRKHTVANQQSVANRNRPKSKITPEVIEQLKHIAKVQSKLPPDAPRDTARKNSLGLAPSTYIRAIRAAGLNPGPRTGPRRRKENDDSEESEEVIIVHNHEDGTLETVETRVWEDLKKEDKEERFDGEEKSPSQRYVNWESRIERLESKLQAEKLKVAQLKKELNLKDTEINRLNKLLETREMVNSETLKEPQQVPPVE